MKAMDNYTESSGVDTSLNSSSAADLSPEIVMSVKPRKLTFGSPNSNESSSNEIKSSSTMVNSPSKMSISPPYRKVRALRLFDSPATPKTIIQKSSGRNLNYLSAANAALQQKASNPHHIPMEQQNTSSMTADRPKPLPLHNRALNNIQSANINPFTPNSLLSHNKKRCRTAFGQENSLNISMPLLLTNQNHSIHSMSMKEITECDDDDIRETHQAPKRLALQDTNISRYEKEFLEISLIGVGEFGLVYQCLNRLDGCIYAIKKSIKPVAGSSFEKRALNEVWAHAVLGKHDNVVRYYSAWAEDNHMLIQNEYCNGGSLQSLIQKRFLCEAELKILLLHIAEGLKYIHSNDLVHMDLKSGNIFLTKVPAKSGASCSSENCDDGFEDIYDELAHSESIITYKIGDLGHVTSYKDAYIEEGDCRYLSNEILQEDFRYLFKADIFSLGITLFEAAGGGPLPKNGPEWHKMRNGQVPEIPTLSKEFNDLIKLMTHPDPEKRPTSTSIFNHPVLCSLESKSKSQLSQELAIERRKNDILLKKLKEAKKLLKTYEQLNPGIKLSLKVETPTTRSERCLRSKTRKRRTSLISTVGVGGIGSGESFRDRNKNVINQF